jgi:hypothetical protein
MMRRTCVLLVMVALALPMVAGDLSIQPAFDGAKWLSAREPIALRLSRAVTPDEGRLAIVIGDVDVTSMFEPVPGGLAWRRDGVPLPAGEREVVVSLVGVDGTWKEVGRFPIKVLTRRGFQKAQARPSLDLTNKGQIDQRQVPDQSFSSRDRYQDLMGQAAMSTEHQRGDVVLRTQTNITGVTYRNEALRFGEKAEHAPLVDRSMRRSSTSPATRSSCSAARCS